MATSTVTVNTPPSKLQQIENIIGLALKGMSLFGGPVAPEAAVASAFFGILQGALNLHMLETGKPFNIQLIGLETPIS